MSLSMYPDYHSHVEGAMTGNRALKSETFDSALLGADDDVVSPSINSGISADSFPSRGPNSMRSRGGLRDGNP